MKITIKNHMLSPLTLHLPMVIDGRGKPKASDTTARLTLSPGGVGSVDKDVWEKMQKGNAALRGHLMVGRITISESALTPSEPTRADNTDAVKPESLMPEASDTDKIKHEVKSVESAPGIAPEPKRAKSK